MNKIKEKSGKAVVRFIIAILAMFGVVFLLVQGYAFLFLFPIFIVAASFWAVIFVVNKTSPNSGTAIKAFLSILFGFLLAVILIAWLWHPPTI